MAIPLRNAYRDVRDDFLYLRSDTDALCVYSSVLRRSNMKTKSPEQKAARELQRVEQRRAIKAYFFSQGLPAPMHEYAFCETRKWRFDYAWPLEKVALEVDGGIFIYGGHNRGKQIQKTWEKENTAQSFGWHIFKCSPKTVCTNEIAFFIAQALNYAHRFDHLLSKIQ